jgi:hypothetical protein
MNVTLSIVDMQVGAKTMNNLKFYRMDAVIETLAALIGRPERKAFLSFMPSIII